jgi:hypothetical protein
MPPQRGMSPVNHHDGILLREWHHIAPFGPLVELGALGEGP